MAQNGWTMSYELQEARELIIKTGLWLVEKGYIARTWGNISARISDSQMVITPSGRSYDSLTPEDIVIVNLSDGSFEGEIKPSGERAVHSRIYNLRKDADFIIHTHQFYASAISVLGEDVEDVALYGDTSSEENTLQKVLGSVVPCAKYALCGTDSLAKNVGATFKRCADAKAVLMKNHGAVAIGNTLEEAVEIVESLETVCKEKYEYICGCGAGATVGGCVVGAMYGAGAEADYGSSYLENGYVHMTIGDENVVWPLGYAQKAKKKDVPKALRAIAMVHDGIYEQGNINFISHVCTPFIMEVSSVDKGALKKGFRPYIDDQAQLVGQDIRNIKIKTGFNKLLNKRAVKKVSFDHGAVFIQGSGAMCFGESRDDIEALKSVLEKGAAAALLSYHIPVLKPLSKKNAIHLRTIYRDSYSKLKDYGMTASMIKNEKEAYLDVAEDGHMQ